MFKRLMIFTLALSLAGAGSAIANHPMDVDKKVDKLKTELVLSDEQVGTVKGILNDYKNRMENLKKEKHDRIHEVLTPEQRDKHDKLMKEWKDKEKHDCCGDKNHKHDDKDHKHD